MAMIKIVNYDSFDDPIDVLLQIKNCDKDLPQGTIERIHEAILKFREEDNDSSLLESCTDIVIDQLESEGYEAEVVSPITEIYIN